MSLQTNSAVKPVKPVVELSDSKAAVIGVIGILLPIGIQDFVVHRFFWGFMHLLSLILVPIGLFLYLFDGYCAGGRFCTSPPGILSFISSCFLGASLALLIFNLVECLELISKRRIVFPEKTVAIVMSITTVVAVLAFFIFRLCMYYL